MQTLFASFARGAALPSLRRQRWETADGDFVDVDRLGSSAEAPTVLVLHGLEGSSQSGYVRETMRLAALRGWNAVALNFRSCSGSPNICLPAYSAGDYRDVKLSLSKLDDEGLRGPRFAVGFSLGGNVLLKLLADEPGVKLTAAAAVSVPFDLAACSARIDGTGPFSMMYRRWFLVTMKKKGLDKALRFPGQLDVERIRRVRGITEFDDAVTARVFGFQSAAEYYARSSSGPVVQLIKVPTLIISAKDDGLAPASFLPQAAYENSALSVVVTERGGHVGFVENSVRNPQYWAEQQVLTFFAQQAMGS